MERKVSPEAAEGGEQDAPGGHDGDDEPRAKARSVLMLVVHAVWRRREAGGEEEEAVDPAGRRRRKRGHRRGIEESGIACHARGVKLDRSVATAVKTRLTRMTTRASSAPRLICVTS